MVETIIENREEPLWASSEKRVNYEAIPSVDSSWTHLRSSWTHSCLGRVIVRAASAWVSEVGAIFRFLFFLAAKTLLRSAHATSCERILLN